MAYKEMFFVQVYEFDKKGRLALGRSYECDDAEHAKRRAETASIKLPGAIAFSQMVNAEIGDAEEPTLLAVYGQVPKEVRAAA